MTRIYYGAVFGLLAKIVHRSDGSGKTDVYFGGSGCTGDGAGHGHIVIDKDDNIIYFRDIAQKHDDYLIDDKQDFMHTHRI